MSQPARQRTLEPIQGLVQRIVEVYQPAQVWLFGSRARGDEHEASDWDLMAVVDDDTPDRLFDPMEIWKVLELRNYYADVVVVSTSEFAEDADTPNTLVYPVKREGQLLHER